ncbi:PepSY-associated TM helix domain-containing protein [Pseudidiomarina donghaiensis]|uniref:PepSY-associated TM helix domain-containing protein n=1 Tax=Pseudidiomarina donghaiensis TaxID=519452 RepID=UPI003A976EDF
MNYIKGKLMKPLRAAPRSALRKKSAWRDIKAWHWISSAACLAATLLFAITGITLNHASSVEASPQKQAIELQVPAEVMQQLQTRQQQLLNGQTIGQGPLPSAFTAWYQQQLSMPLVRAQVAQWDEFEVYVGMPRAGGDRWFRVDLETAEFYQEDLDRGWVAYFNDLHKGRNTGFGWVLMLDLLAVIMGIFAITGLILLKRYAKGRKSTWPLVLAGIVVPWLVLLIPMHVTAAEAKQATLELTIPELQVAEYHRPYVAIWLADERHQRIADIAVWYDLKLANKEGEKWLKDMRQWWRRSGRMAELPIDGVTGATRRPGSHRLALPKLLTVLQAQSAGNYTLNIEAAREVGGREHLQIPIKLPLTLPFTADVTGQHELGHIRLTID